MQLAAFTDEINRDDPQRALDLASAWGLSHVEIRGLPGGRFPRPSDAALDDLGRRVADAGHGCRLVLENEAVCWGDTGVEAAAALRRFGADNLLLCWDPGNAPRAGSADPFPGEYGQLRDLVAHVHLKNFQPAEGRWSVMEAGVVDWPGQLGALASDGYGGFLVIETHTDLPLAKFDLTADLALDGLSPREAASRRNLDYARALLAGLA